MKANFIHDCERCQYLGTDAQGSDWYACGKWNECRTLIRRFGGEDYEYESGKIGVTVTPQRIVIRAARMGFKFNDAEKQKFAEAYIRDFKAYKSMQDSREGPAAEDEELLSMPHCAACGVFTENLVEGKYYVCPSCREYQDRLEKVLIDDLLKGEDQ